MGVTNVGLVANTAEPVPVSSVKAANRLAELNDPNDVALPTLVTAPVKLAFVVTLPAVKPAAVPVMFVPTNALGVPSAGVTSVGDVANTNDPEPVSSDTAAAICADVATNVLLVRLMVLLVSVSVVSRPTRVVVASGSAGSQSRAPGQPRECPRLAGL